MELFFTIEAVEGVESPSVHSVEMGSLALVQLYVGIYAVSEQFLRFFYSFYL